MTKKKSKVAEFFGTIGMGLAFVWMLPVLAVEGLQEHFEKKRKAKQPKPEPIQFVCSECGETFEADNIEREMRNHASSNGDYTYSLSKALGYGGDGNVHFAPQHKLGP